MKIVFAAGCLNKQKNVPLKKHYHFLLRELIRGRINEYPTVHLVSYQSYFQLAEKMQAPLNLQPDVFVLFLRPFPMQGTIKPFIRYRNSNNEQKLALHPAISRSTFPTDVLDGFADNRINGPSKVSPMQRIAARFNVLAGKMFGLDNWAVNYIWHEILTIQANCKCNNIRLILSGPPMYPNQSHINNICSRLNAQITRLSQGYNLSHAAICTLTDNDGNMILEEDGIHITPMGHQFIARSIFNIIDRW